MSENETLADVAARLNESSAALNKSVDAINVALKKLNLGVAAAITIPYNDEVEIELSYDRLDRSWGILIARKRADQEEWEEWHFASAPRALRMLVVDEIPRLFVVLEAEAQKKLKEVEAARDLAILITNAFREQPSQEGPHRGRE